MVVKTELCAFSEYKIYPGHGQKFIRRDGQPINLLTSKVKQLNIQRKKPATLTWTTAWRRLNKKANTEGSIKKKTRKVVRIQRAIVGASLEDLHKKRTAPRTNVATEAALQEVKARSAAKGKAAGKGPAAKVAVPKIQRSNANARGGTTR